MSATITWSIMNMATITDEYPDTVHVAMVSVKAEQDGVQAIANEPFIFERPTGNFTPYNELTEAQVLQWVFDIIKPEGVAQREAGVLSNLEAQLNPPSVPVPAPLPWVTG